jgi:hypothetical protein
MSEFEFAMAWLPLGEVELRGFWEHMPLDRNYFYLHFFLSLAQNKNRHFRFCVGHFFPGLYLQILILSYTYLLKF